MKKENTHTHVFLSATISRVSMCHGHHDNTSWCTDVCVAHVCETTQTGATARTVEMSIVRYLEGRGGAMLPPQSLTHEPRTERGGRLGGGIKNVGAGQNSSVCSVNGTI